jgi:RND family efflux transporter MFP subunit
MKMLPKTENRLLIVLTGALLLLASCSGTDKKETDDGTLKEPEKVKIMILESQKIANNFEFTSSLLPFEEVYLSPATPGRIDKIDAEVGSRFSKGDLLVVMDQTQLHQARTQLKSLEMDMLRFDTLIKTNSIPRQQYDQLKTQVEISRTNVQFLEENSRLRAPFSGIVSGKYYQNGEMFSGAPNTQAGKAAVLTLVQINPLKAIVNVTERYYPIIKNGMDVQLVSDIYPDKPVDAKVLRVYPTIDQVSRTFQVELAVPNSKEELRPGMFCRSSFAAGEIDALIVPSMAVLKLQGSNERFVFIEKDGKAVRVKAEIGRRFDDKVELLSKDIKMGDKLIVSGQSRLVDGTPVKVVQ